MPVAAPATAGAPWPTSPAGPRPGGPTTCGGPPGPGGGPVNGASGGCPWPGSALPGWPFGPADPRPATPAAPAEPAAAGLTAAGLTAAGPRGAVDPLRSAPGTGTAMVVAPASGRDWLVIDFAFVSRSAIAARRPPPDGDPSVGTGWGPVDGPPGNAAPTAMAGAVALGSVPGSAGRPGVDSCTGTGEPWPEGIQWDGSPAWLRRRGARDTGTADGAGVPGSGGRPTGAPGRAAPPAFGCRCAEGPDCIPAGGSPVGRTVELAGDQGDADEGAAPSFSRAARHASRQSRAVGGRLSAVPSAFGAASLSRWLLMGSPGVRRARAQGCRRG